MLPSNAHDRPHACSYPNSHNRGTACCHHGTTTNRRSNYGSSTTSGDRYTNASSSMNFTPPSWALALTFWLHLLATVTWVGSLAGVSFLVLPAMQRSLDPETQLVFIEAMQKRLEPIAWFSMSLLLATGLFQMSVNPHYDGFLSTSTQWSLAILTKHLLGIIMVVVSAIQTWEVIPAIRRAIINSKKSKTTEIYALSRRGALLMRAV